MLCFWNFSVACQLAVVFKKIFSVAYTASVVRICCLMLAGPWQWWRRRWQPKTVVTYIHTHYTPCLKNVPPLACYNFDTREWILILFGRNVTDEVCNQETLYYAIWNNCASGKTKKNTKMHFHLNTVLVHCLNSTSCLISFTFLTHGSY